VHAVAAITRGWGGGVVAGWVFGSDVRLHPVAATTSIVGVQANRHAFVFILRLRWFGCPCGRSWPSTPATPSGFHRHLTPAFASGDVRSQELGGKSCHGGDEV